MKDYLWEKKGEGDAETKQLEGLLGAARFSGMELPPAPPRRRRLSWRRLAVAGAGLAAAAAVAFFFEPRGAYFEVHNAKGEAARLYVAKWFETGVNERAEIRVAQIGKVELQPQSRVRLLRTDAQQHRLELTRGSLHAKVLAPPRLFVVETPSATAVDLGCEYDLTIEPGGGTRLQVRTGWVELEGAGKRSLVPAGMECLTRPGKGPGTPIDDDAPAELRAALTRFDDGEASAIDDVLSRVGDDDAVTLWHLLARVQEAKREAVYARLDALVPAPGDKARILALDKVALDAWWEAITDADE